MTVCCFTIRNEWDTYYSTSIMGWDDVVFMALTALYIPLISPPLPLSFYVDTPYPAVLIYLIM